MDCAWRWTGGGGEERNNIQSSTGSTLVGSTGSTCLQILCYSLRHQQTGPCAFSTSPPERDPTQHGDWLTAVKFSPSGEYIATASCKSRVRVWDANTGNRLLEISRSSMDNWSHAPLAWLSDSKRLFYVTSDGKVTYHDIYIQRHSTMASSHKRPWLLLSRTDGRFIAYSTPISLSFWDTSSYTRIGFPIEVEGGIYGVALSSDNNYFASGGRGKVTIYTLGNILPKGIFSDACVQSHSLPEHQWSDSSQDTSHVPLMQVSDAAFKPWIECDLKSTEAILSREIGSCGHHALANRALVNIHLNQWDPAVDEAKRVHSLPVLSSSRSPHHTLVPHHQPVAYRSHCTRGCTVWSK